MLVELKWGMTWPSIMYEIIIMESTAASGNLRGDFEVSMSKARTTGSARFNLSAMTSRVTWPALALTVYHFPMRMSSVSQIVRSDTFIYCDTDVVWDIPFSSIDYMLNRV